MLNIVNSNISFEESGNTLPSHPFDFPLDNFQKYAISAISRNENVLITAKTGSGKTLVGEYQVYTSLQKNKRVIYTTPIKSLSNQKFHDFKKIYGDKVGIATGDIKFCPQAPILIMTTEILRNLLYKKNTSTQDVGITAGISLENLDAVIFDEVHYINDPERGRVWEETMVLLPKEVNLVLLSATIDSPEHFANWLCHLKQKPMHLISTDYRIIPLTHYVIDNNKQFQTIMDNKGKFDKLAYTNWIKQKTLSAKNYEEFKEKVKNREPGQVITNKFRIASFTHTLNETINLLKEKELLPALFFVFSRKDCEKYANAISESLIDSSDSAAVKHIIEFHLYKHKATLEHLSQYHSLFDLLKKGIAYHHSGLLPILKEIVEILFNKGFVKVLFATETFAVGINMPTKTVVFLDYKKFDDKRNDLRILRTDEYLQMAGRAGRRGKDVLGTVIYLPVRNPISADECRVIMTGKNNTIESKMTFSYDFILKAIHSGKSFSRNFPENLSKDLDENLPEKTFYNYQIKQRVSELHLENETLSLKQNELNLEPYLPDLLERQKIEAKTGAIKQKELNVWTNKHMGPKWNEASKKFVEWKKLQNSMNSNLESIKILEYNPIQENTENLQRFGFIENTEELKLTQKGLIATEINEMDCLTVAEAYSIGLLNKLNETELIGFVSMFQDGKFESENSLEISSNLKSLHSNLKSIMQLFYPEQEQSLNLNWIEPLMNWCENKAMGEICLTYELFPGNLIRCILSVQNSIEELINICTLTSNVSMLEKLNNCKKLLLRNETVSDSLYLTI